MIVALGAFLLAGSAAGAATGGEDAPVAFANSCAVEVQADFQRAVLLLHSFEYPESARIFGEILERESTCAMAFWGAAMSIWHPLWAPPSAAELDAGARLLAKAEGLETTPREAAYLDALRAFFSNRDPATHLERARAFEARMATLYQAHLDDPEAAIFYALSLLATADPRDKSYAQQFKAAGILSWVRESRPEHPGVLHYLIHSYDSPGLAHLALSAAETYASAAPDSAHAQHMPSHIFTRLGLWERSQASNLDSTRSAAAYTAHARLPGHYDEGLHGMDYSMYALLQMARDDEARDLLARLREIERSEPQNFKAAYTYAAAPARFELERRSWKAASQLELHPTSFPWEEFGWARSIHHFARGIGAARAGDLGAAGREAEAIESLQARLPPTTLPYWREEVQVHLDAVRSWILFAEGEVESALATASAAADREDAVDKHPVTPGEVLPARELYADMLAVGKQHERALAEYQRVLDGSPNRLNALLGAAASATAIGDRELAQRYYGVARSQTREGNRGRSGLSLAWASSR